MHENTEDKAEKKKVQFEGLREEGKGEFPLRLSPQAAPLKHFSVC